MKALLIVIILSIIVIPIFAEEKKEANPKNFVEILAELEAKDASSFLKTWLDAEAIEHLPQTHLTDDYIKELYLEFENTIVTPPDPDNYKEYSINNGEEALIKIDALGRLINTMLFYLPNEDIDKYSGLLWSMRDVLYLDLKHIPLVIKHDRSRDVYWHRLHTKWAKAAKGKYLELFKATR